MFFVVFGIAGIISLKSSFFPLIDSKFISINATYPGASPEDVESLITNRAEQELQTIKNLKKIKSTSSESVAVLTLEFTSDFDISDARTKVREKMDQIKQLKIIMQ